ncbi:MAG: radical SAM protein [Candidatus Sericytochromatia bacterium]|nr:radical SAM protein [Candidatus Tanganyikabacteria bacterium]
MQHRFHLNLTGVCNLACTHCYQDDHTGKPIPLPQVEEILRKFQAFRQYHGEKGRGNLTIAGGEPTSRRDLEDVIRLTRRYGFTLRMVTNATMIDLSRAKALRRAGLKMVQVSLDGATPETHEAVRGRNSWDRTLKGIEALRKAGIFVILSMVLMPDHNLHEAPLLLDLSRRLKVWGVKYQRLVQRGHAALNLQTQGEFHACFVRILEHANAIKYRRFLMFFEPLAHNLPNLYPELCKGLWMLVTDMCHCDQTELMEVDYNGDVFYCRVGERLGNVWQDDLVDVWEHPILQTIRSREAKGSCSGCQVWDNCRGGCPAVTFGLHQDVLAPDHACPAWAPEDASRFVALPLATTGTPGLARE